MTMVQNQEMHFISSLVPKLQDAHSNVVLAQTLPEAVALGVDGHNHVVDGLRDGVLPF